jgi:hypothetical protein
MMGKLKLGDEYFARKRTQSIFIFIGFWCWWLFGAFLFDIVEGESDEGGMSFHEVRLSLVLFNGSLFSSSP